MQTSVVWEATSARRWLESEKRFTTIEHHGSLHEVNCEKEERHGQVREWKLKQSARCDRVRGSCRKWSTMQSITDDYWWVGPTRRQMKRSRTGRQRRLVGQAGATFWALRIERRAGQAAVRNLWNDWSELALYE